MLVPYGAKIWVDVARVPAKTGGLRFVAQRKGFSGLRIWQANRFRSSWVDLIGRGTGFGVPRLLLAYSIARFLGLAACKSRLKAGRTHRFYASRLPAHEILPRAGSRLYPETRFAAIGLVWTTPKPVSLPKGRDLLVRTRLRSMDLPRKFWT